MSGALCTKAWTRGLPVLPPASSLQRSLLADPQHSPPSPRPFLSVTPQQREGGWGEGLSGRSVAVRSTWEGEGEAGDTLGDRPSLGVRQG